jgi:hypothetical protein
MWYVWFDKFKNKYQLSNTECNWVAAFVNFDMAYDYVTKANKMSDVMAYSRWAR